MLPSFLLGFAAGLRTGTPLAVLALERRGERPKTAALATLAAAGELIGDKLPQTPSRTAPLPAAARIAAGACAGAFVNRAASGRTTGALAGAAGATIGTRIGYRIRTMASQRLGRDLPVALVEDMAAIGLSAVALRLAR